jgi:flagellar hook-basal body complex protein FliE
MVAETEKAELKRLIREAHEAIQELKQAKADLDASWKRIRKDIEDQIEAEVLSAVEQMSDHVQEATERATNLVFERYTQLAEIMLGETKADQRKRTRTGEPSMADLLVRAGGKADEAQREALREFAAKNRASG